MSDIYKSLQEFIQKEFAAKDTINVLEAGCGSLGKITFNTAARITGIDISAKQLERNKYIHEKIQGDLQTYTHPAAKYDIIVCWDVLEHLKKPRLALDNMHTALKPGGLLLVKIPNLMSFKGLFTKFSPHWIHVLYYKLIYKQKNAGKEDTGPFKTYLKYQIAPQKLKKYAGEHGLDVPFSDLWDITDFSYTFKRTKHAELLKSVYLLLKSFFKVVSFGKLKGSEFIIIMRKRDGLI